MKNKFSQIQNTKANLALTNSWSNPKFAFPKRKIRVGTSFSGIGAIEHALNRLGLKSEIVFAGDVDKDCKRAYLGNYKLSESQWHDDIAQFNASPYKGKVDLFVGGAPCQAFSIRGKRGGFEDTRGTLFSEFARVVMEVQPKVFIFENVKGLINHDRGKTWKTILKTFEDDCGYQVYYQVLNSKDYGVPQSRDRIFCVGFLKDCDFKFPKPIELTSSLYDCLDRTVSAKYFFKEKGSYFVTRSINTKKKYTQVNGTIAVCQKRNQQFNWHGDFVFHPILETDCFADIDESFVFNIYDFEEQYYANEGSRKYALIKNSDSEYRMVEANVNTSYGRFRKLSPRECLNLMGFDQSFKVLVSDTACYKQAGNSIVVDVLMAILCQMDITQYGIDEF